MLHKMFVVMYVCVFDLSSCSAQALAPAAIAAARHLAFRLAHLCIALQGQAAIAYTSTCNRSYINIHTYIHTYMYML